MSRLEQPDGSVYGVKVDSIPMDGKCMFDTMNACVVFYVKVRRHLPASLLAVE